jgi:hypothetical protein
MELQEEDKKWMRLCVVMARKGRWLGKKTDHKKDLERIENGRGKKFASPSLGPDPPQNQRSKDLRVHVHLVFTLGVSAMDGTPIDSLAWRLVAKVFFSSSP